MSEYLIKSESELSCAADWFINNIQDRKIFTFSGEMGAGKTTFIKAICKALKVEQVVSSPSFALVYEYYSPLKGSIYHFDLYRVKEISELYDLGYEDYFYSDSLCLIEWPEIAEYLFPPDRVSVKIEVNQDESRRVIMNG